MSDPIGIPAFAALWRLPLHAKQMASGLTSANRAVTRLPPHHGICGVAEQNIKAAAHTTNGLAAVTFVVHLGNLAKSLDVGNMSEYATQLSVILVDEFFGGLSSRVFGALAFNGRLPFPRLLQHTRLSPTEVKYGLSVLIQQQLVLWYIPEETLQASYEADIPNSFALARCSKYTQLVKDRLGDLPADVISDVTVLGYARVGDLTRTYFLPPGEQRPFREIIPVDPHLDRDDKKPATLHSFSRDNAHAIELFRTTLGDLLRAGLLGILHESHFRPAADNVLEAEHIVPREFHVSSKKAQQAAWEMAVAKKLEDWKYGSKSETDTAPLVGRGVKRALEESEDQHKGKKIKLGKHPSSETNGANAYPDLAEAGWLDKDLNLRLNHEKFSILMRNQQLVALVEESIGPTTAKVYAKLLCNVEPQLRKCKNELDFVEDNEGDGELATLPRVSTDGLTHELHDMPDLADALASVDPGKVNLSLLEHPKKVRKRRKSQEPGADEASVEGTASSDESDDSSDDDKSDISGIDHDSGSVKGDTDYSEGRNHKTPDTTPDTTPRMKDPESPLHPLRQHLFLLAEHPYHFLRHVPRTLTTSEAWVIPYPNLSHLLLHNALLNITISRFGPLGGRLLRILSSTPTATSLPPKLDEKALVLLSLIPQKPMRTLLHSMHRAGHIELQELPKDGNQRRPGTTSFYWFFDPERMRRRVLEETYKTMGNLLRRARVEREGVRGVVEKSERTDVVGREDEFLGDEELKALHEWREKEERIWGEVARLDDLVAVLRDF
ncbi:MAG: hypothetical protein L6R35_000002 [Caloplaca aegaea]|nr:MAG: hypothetical protein L6R35_000002 [Caloplaca aegaea]